MERKIVSGIMLTLLLVSMLTLAFNIRRAKSSEPPPTEWTRTYGGTAYDGARSVVQTGDGGYALAGRTDSYGAGGWDFWLVKTDGSGVMQWNRTYGGTSHDYAYSVVQTGDGGYALAGHTRSYGAGNNDFWLVKTDSAGNAVWNQTYGGTGSEDAWSVVQTGDGGYALAGHTYSYGAGGWDFWLVKTDSVGNMEWSRTYGGTADDVAYSMVQTGDGGYALAGYTGSYGAGNNDFWLVKTDSVGNMEWSRTYGGTGFDVAYSVVQTSDGGYALAGYTGSFGAGIPDFWLVKTDSVGNMEWSRTYGGGAFEWAYSVVQTVDGGYAIAGYTDSYGAGNYDFWLVKTNSAGNVQWNQTYGGTSSDVGSSVVQTVDGGYAIAGRTYSFGAGLWDFWLVKLGPKASGIIYIKADGSVDPSTANITSVDNVTYSFTGNIFDYSIIVERDNVIVDGAGYTLQGPALEWWGIDLTGRSNVTIKNMKIKAFDTSIYLESSSGNAISGNNITANDWGIYLYQSFDNSILGNNITNSDDNSVCLDQSSNNTISGNTMTNSSYSGVWLYSSSNYNTVSGNTITNNYLGIRLDQSSNNTISGNNITANKMTGIYPYQSFDNSILGNNITNNPNGVNIYQTSNNRLYHNNFIDNPTQVHIFVHEYANFWDDGYPSGGNYWSDYTGVDLYSGLEQDQPGSDGIGDTSYIIDDDNIDHYPLSSPFPQTPDFDIVVSPSAGTTAQGTTVTTDVYVSAIAGYDYLVSLSASGQPEGVTIDFNPNTGTPYFTSTMTIQVGDSVPPNTYTITVTGLGSDDTTHSTTYTLTVTVPPYDVTIDAYCHTEDAHVSVSITMDGTPTGYNTPHTFTGLTNTHTFTVPNTDINGHPFKEWNTGETSTTITVSSGGTYTAYYQAYTLTITTTTGGTTNPAPESYEYADGEVAVVSAIPDTGYIFDHWELNGDNVGSTNPISVIMTSDLTLHAVFSWVGTYNLTITTTTGGTTDPAPGIHTYTPGAVAVVSAIPDINYWFDHWELDGNYFGLTNPRSVTMNTDHTLHAVFVDTGPPPIPEYPATDISIVAATFGFLAALYFTLKRKKQSHPTTGVTSPSKA